MFFSRGKPTSGQIIDALGEVLSDYFSIEREMAQTFVSLNKDEVLVTLPFVMRTQHYGLRDTLLAALPATNKIKGIQFAHKVRTAQTATAPKTNIKNIIAVASGKGGVGKSTTAVNLALALKQEGASVGILDADIYGPSVPILLGNPDAKPMSADNKHMQPLESYGVVANSIGYLVAQEDAAVWRGPMASRALNQILDETLWPVLDYLIVDMPPGTGDIQLTMSQQVPLSAAVVVSTPQDLALADAEKGIAMFNKVNIPVLGVVENMSYFQCGHCGEKTHIFAAKGGDKLATRHDVPLLAELPLDIGIREHADAGTPIVQAAPETPIAQRYRELARDVSMQLALTVAVSDNGESHIRGDQIGIKQY